MSNEIMIWWIDAKFCEGMHTKEEALEHTVDTFDKTPITQST